jgi:hypothetical protein
MSCGHTDKPAIAPQPRTINLTQEQRFIIKENVKDLGLAKAPVDAPETKSVRTRRRFLSGELARRMKNVNQAAESDADYKARVKAEFGLDLDL